MSAFRRRLMMQQISQSDGKTKSNWYTIGSVDSSSQHAFVIVLSGTNYIYASEYPFYFYEDASGFYISYASGFTTRNGTSYVTGTSNGTIDGITYKKETIKRTVSVVSKTDIYVWEE